jgi:hypothetical protein
MLSDTFCYHDHGEDLNHWSVRGISVSTLLVTGDHRLFFK